MADGSSTAAASSRRHHHRRVVDSISSLPDAILQHILCFIPTKFAIRTSLLSRRWKHVWCDIASLSFRMWVLESASIYRTLTHYTAPKMMNFLLHTNRIEDVQLIKFVMYMSHNVENMYLEFEQLGHGWNEYKLPDFFYINSSLKQLDIKLMFGYFFDVIPTCTSVSWTSLKILSLRCCTISDESMANILSGCPVLESLTLYICDQLRVLDISRSPRLRTLEIYHNVSVLGPTKIVAPHLHCLRLRFNSKSHCTLVDVSSLAEAELDICFASVQTTLKADFLQNMVLKTLEKLQNVEKLTLGGNFLEVYFGFIIEIF